MIKRFPNYKQLTWVGEWMVAARGRALVHFFFFFYNKEVTYRAKAKLERSLLFATPTVGQDGQLPEGEAS